MVPDANVAEMATLFATMLTLLVGMGTIKVQDDAGNTLDDPTQQHHQLTKAEQSAFYVIICESVSNFGCTGCCCSMLMSSCVRTPDVTMTIFCTMTIGIIVRRLGGVVVQVQRGNNRPFKPKFPELLAGRRYSSLRDRRRHLEQQAQDLYEITQEEIRLVAGEIGTAGDKALIDLMKTKHKNSNPTGLPDEISEMISKDQLEAAQTWFNERVPDADKRVSDSDEREHRISLDNVLDSIGKWTIATFVLVAFVIQYVWDDDTCSDKSDCSNSFGDWYWMFSCVATFAVVVLKIKKYVKELEPEVPGYDSSMGSARLRGSAKVKHIMRQSIAGAKARDYIVTNEEIDELIESIRQYKQFVDRTEFNYNAKFANRFSEAGYKGAFRTQVTGRHGIYAWLGTLEGNDQALKPIQKFLIDLDKSAEAQRWASIQAVKPMYEFCLKPSTAQRSMTQSTADTMADTSALSIRDASANPLLMGLGEEDLDSEDPLEQFVILSGSGQHGIRLAPDMTVSEIQLGSAAARTPGIVEAKSNAHVLLSLDGVALTDHVHAMQAIEDAWNSQASETERRLKLWFQKKERRMFKSAVREVVLRKDDSHEMRHVLEFSKDRTVRVGVTPGGSNPFEGESPDVQREQEDRDLRRVQEQRLKLLAVNGEPVEDLPHEQLTKVVDEHFNGSGSEIVLSFGKPGRRWYEYLNVATLRHSLELLVVGGTDHTGRERPGYPKSVFFILTRLYFVGETHVAYRFVCLSVKCLKHVHSLT
jgi:hypothetical protein